MSTTGERLTSITRRIKTPTSVEWTDGRSVDAGTGMIVSSNLAHLQYESLRHLASGIGPGLCPVNNRGWTSVNLIDSPDPGSYTGVGIISWSHDVSRVLGPCSLIKDKEQASESPGYRQIKLVIDASAGGVGSMTLYAVATMSGDRPSTESSLGFQTLTAATGRARNVITMTVQTNLRPQPLSCRGAGAEQSQVTLIDLHVGWYSTNAADAIITMSAFEIR